MTREEVYKIIDAEREYQDIKWPITIPFPPSDELRVVRHLLAKADETWYVTGDAISNGARVNESDMTVIRKIAAVCVRAMENYPTPTRQE